jgi:uncharacterized protein YecE (DUF72 family)
MDLHAGTSGFSYKAWKGTFYPSDLPAGDMLRYYAGRLPAVEINNTFYRMPRASVLESWAGQVPEGFRFSLKASRRITHFKRLENAAEETGYLLRTAASLGSRLGVLLFQLPPHFKADRGRLEAFLKILPEGTRAAFEFRHPSWLEEGIYQLLRSRDLALCISDSDSRPAEEMVRTASWGYLRLRRSGYADEDLSSWMKNIRDAGWERAFIFFKHEEDGAGPRMAERFLEIAGPVPADISEPDSASS